MNELIVNDSKTLNILSVNINTNIEENTKFSDILFKIDDENAK